MLAHKFALPCTAYMCGHSLGPMPLLATQYLQQGLQQWQDDGVAGWNKHHWFDLPQQLGRRLLL